MSDDVFAELDAQIAIHNDEVPERPEPEAEVASEPEVTSDRPRDEQGRFAKAEAEVEVETEPEAEQEEEIDWTLGKFKTPEALAKAYQEVERKLGQQGNEYGELKQQLDEIREQLTPQQQVQFDQQYQIPDRQMLDWFDEQVESQPGQAAYWALSQGNNILYDRAMAQWAETEPWQAMQFHTQTALALQRAQQQVELQPVLDPLIEDKRQRALGNVVENVAGKHPDFNQVSGAMLEVAQENPELVAQIGNGATPEQAERIIENLYYLAKGRQADSLSDAVKTVTAQQAAEIEAAKREAFVASGSNRNEPEPKSNQEKWLEEVFDPAAAQYY